MKTGKRLILLSAVVLLAALGGVGYFRGGGGQLEIVITQKRIDEALARKFPKSKTYLKVIDLTLDHPVAKPVPGTDQVRIGLDARAGIGLAGIGKEYRGGATVVSRIRYDETDKTFYLCDSVFERLDLPKVSAKHRQSVMDAASLLSLEVIREVPVYTLTSKDTKQHLARWLLKEVVVEDEQVRARFGL